MAVFFMGATATPLFAQTTAVPVAVVDVDGNTNPVATDIHYFVQKGVRLSERDVELSRLDEVLAVGEYADAIQNVAFGMQFYTSGMAAFDAGNCEEAVDQFSQASTFFEISFWFLPDADMYLTLLLRQGVCLSRMGNTDGAVQVLKRAYVFRSRLDASAFPEEEQLFTQAKEAAAASGRFGIRVTSVPEGGRVFVNGRYRGVSPAYRPSLSAGVHYVALERQGYTRAGQQVVTGGGGGGDVAVAFEQQPARKAPALENLLAGLQQEMGGERAGSMIQRLQGLLLVDYVLLYRASGPASATRVELCFYNLNSGALLKCVEGTTNWEQRNRSAKNAVIELAKDVLDVELHESVAVVPVQTAPRAEVGDGVHTKWWFWTTIGAVLVGGAVGLTFALLPEEKTEGLPQDGNGALLLRF